MLHWKLKCYEITLRYKWHGMDNEVLRKQIQNEIGWCSQNKFDDFVCADGKKN